MKAIRRRPSLPNRPNATRRRSGAAIVEAAITLPIFFLVILGIVEFGRAMMVSQLLTNGAREGARLAIVDGSSNSECETAVKDFLTSTLGVTDEDITVQITVTPATGNPDPGDEVANARTRDLCSIHVELNFDKVSFAPATFLKSRNLVGQCAMRHE